MTELTVPDHLLTPARAVTTRATTDAELLASFLARCASDHTRRAYRRELERFLVHCAGRGQGLRDVLLEDLQQYQQLLAGDLDLALVGTKAEPRFMADGSVNPTYRPFTKTTLSAASQCIALTALRQCFAFATKTGYLPADPAHLLTIPKAPKKLRVERLLTKEQVDYVIDHVSHAQAEGAVARREQARARFLLKLLFATGARLNEVAQARMRDVWSDAQGRWWLDILFAKKDSARTVPLDLDTVAAFDHYRAVFDVSDAQAKSDMALILSARRLDKRGITDDAVANIVKATFGQAADNLAAQGFDDDATVLNNASTHWLRHACASYLLNVKGVAPTQVQQNLGHASLNTTAVYTHDDAHLRHFAITGQAPSESVTRPLPSARVAPAGPSLTLAPETIAEPGAGRAEVEPPGMAADRDAAFTALSDDARALLAAKDHDAQLRYVIRRINARFQSDDGAFSHLVQVRAEIAEFSAKHEPALHLAEALLTLYLQMLPSFAAWRHHVAHDE